MPKIHKPPLPTRTLGHAKQLRGTSTDAEQALWFRLRAKRLHGLKFRRQHPIPPYIVDSYCNAHKLVVELDGSQHSEVTDARRTGYLERQGLTVLRFWDNEVLQQLGSVLESILHAVDAAEPSPQPSPGGRGGKKASSDE
ncbi:MAG TPA: endonuclease domain-containing protein [Oleiagrimonas sp.]|nr:endonuclease domain-containing protein [Oleiagrimonas sp.]